MKTILIIGCGEVGSQLKRVEEERGNTVYVAELNKPLPEKRKYNVAHIAIPYSDSFIMTIVGYLLTYKPRITIIHSTIPVGTTSKIYELTECPIVHSPIIGRSPNLYKNLKQMDKPVGGELKTNVNVACKHLEDILMKPICSGTSLYTERNDKYLINMYKPYRHNYKIKPVDTIEHIKKDFLGYSIIAKVRRKMQNYFVKNFYRGKWWRWEA